MVVVDAVRVEIFAFFFLTVFRGGLDSRSVLLVNEHRGDFGV